MNYRTKNLIAVCIAMAAGGFTNSLLVMSPVGKACVVGLVTAAVLVIMWGILRPRKSA